MVLDGRSSQEYPVNGGVSQGSILGFTLFLLYINDLPDNVICNIAIYADHATLYFLLFFIFNWDSPHAKLNSHYEVWSYKKKSTKNITGYRKSV